MHFFCFVLFFVFVVLVSFFSPLERTCVCESFEYSNTHKKPTIFFSAMV